MIRVHLSYGSLHHIHSSIPSMNGADRSHIQPRPLPIPWQGVRLFLADLIAKAPAVDPDEAMAAEADALYLIFHQLRPQNPIAGAHPDGFLSHNGHMQKPLYRAVSLLLRQLIGERDWWLVIPNINHLDLESLSVFRGMLQASPRFFAVFGMPPLEPDAPLTAKVHHRQLHGHLIQLEAHDYTQAIRETNPSADVSLDPDQINETPPLATPETVLWADLTQTPGRAVNPKTALAVCERAFRCFGFQAVVQLGEAVARTPLEPEQIAFLHRLIGIAAYNIQVQSMGDLDLADFLQYHFERALAHETDPVAKAHLYYRLAINTGRRQGNLNNALEQSNTGLNLIADDPSPRAAFTTGWLLNGRAFVLARLKDMDRAVADCERALDLLADLEPDADLFAEVPMTRAVVTDNLGKLSLFAGKYDEGRRRQQDLARIEEEQVEGLHISFHRWVAFARAQHLLSEARRQAEKGLEHARTNMLPLYEDHFAMELGDLCYRLGDPDKALELFASCRGVRQRIGAPAELTRLELNLALTHARLGRFDEALSGFNGILDTLEDDGPRAEILAEIALVEAAAGRYTEDRINAAIEAAVASGDQGVLMRVACRAGDICLLIRESESAVEAYSNVRDIGSVGQVPADPAAQWHAVLGLLKCTGHPNLLLDSLTLLPAALENAHTWWSLNALARIQRHALTHLPTSHAYRQEPPLADGLALLIQVVSQRLDADQDVLTDLTRLHQRLPKPNPAKETPPRHLGAKDLK